MHIPPLNEGRPFAGIELRTRDGACVRGVLDARGTTDEAVSVLVPHKVLPVVVASAAVASREAFPLPTAPDGCYTIRFCNTGGITTAPSDDTPGSIYHRRHAIAAVNPRGAQKAPVMVVDCDEDALQRLRVEYEGIELAESGVDEAGAPFRVIRVPGRALPTVLLAAWRDFGLQCVCALPEERMPSILADTFGRSKHSYAQQSKHMDAHELGPVNNKWRHCVDELPPTWLDGLPPFTWAGTARCVYRDARYATGGCADGLGATLRALPEPLRLHALQQGVEEERAQAAAAERRARSLTCEAVCVDNGLEAAQSDARLLGALVDRAHTERSFGDAGRDALDRRVLAEERDRVVAQAMHLATRERRALQIGLARAADQLEAAGRCAALVAEALQAYAPAPPPRCPPLTDAQQTQLLHAFHIVKYGAELVDARELDAAKAALLQARVCNGTILRLVTGYDVNSGKHRGMGNELAQPVKDVTALPVAVRNRLQWKDGRWKGQGSNGSRGIVNPKGATYTPAKHHRRHVSDSALMRTEPLRKVPRGGDPP